MKSHLSLSARAEFSMRGLAEALYQLKLERHLMLPRHYRGRFKAGARAASLKRTAAKNRRLHPRG